MKHLLITIIIFSFTSFSEAKNDTILKQNNELNELIIYQQKQKLLTLEKELVNHQDALLNQTINTYQQTNDRINNYLTFTGIIATIFGLIIALGGFLIGFESIKSQRKTDQAIKTLEEAKNYVKNKKSEFDNIITNKISELEEEYKNILKLSKERLVDDVNFETKKVKDIAQKKSQEIEEYSVDEKTDKTLELLQKRIAFFENIGIPDDPDILLSKAKLLSNKEMHLEAIELLEKLVKLKPDNSGALWNLGWEYAKILKHNESIDAYKRCIELDPKNSSAINNLGFELENTNQLYDALQKYNKSIELNSSKKLYYNNKARVLILLNSNDEVLNTYKDLLKLDEKDTNIYNSIINFLKSLEKFEETIDYYDLAIKNVEENNQNYKASKALILKQLKRFDEAILIFQELIEVNFKPETCYLLISEIKYEQNKIDEAIQTLDSAIKLYPKSSNLYFKKASFQFKDNSEDSYNTLMEGAKQIEGKNYLQSAGRYFSKLGHLKFSQQFYEKSNLILKEKLNEKKESDIIEYYEGLIITDNFEEADLFLKEHKLNIISKKNEVIVDFIKLCEQLSLDKIQNISEKLLRFEENAKSESFVKIEWYFEDILYWAKLKSNEKTYETLLSVSKLLTGEINMDEFKSK